MRKTILLIAALFAAACPLRAIDSSVNFDQNRDLSSVIRELRANPNAPPNVRASFFWINRWQNPAEAVQLSFDPNVSASLRGQILGDMAFIGNIQGRWATRLHQQIFGWVDGAGYLRFFQARITLVGVYDDKDGMDVAFVSDDNPHKIWLTPNYLKFRLPQMARISILFHESRHSERARGSWYHSICPQFEPLGPDDIFLTKSPLAGRSDCDKTPKGGYGLQVVLLKNIQKFCANCTKEVRTQAGLYGDYFLKRIIPDDARKTLLDDLYQP